MDATLMQEASKYGFFAVLFVGLLIYTMRKSDAREDRLLNHLDRTTETLQKIEQSISRIPVMEESISNMQEEIKDIHTKMGGN
ncbi:BhlA/UviB family holin-like peptide [Priestia megaterium]|uniref:BhlA/UviB family holin-like peptide n=1 Tax=Priestia megaterium TaxID=1404 RepID=UPI00203AE9E7|nr:BhlA/UviB family holin-like peptide [Priestia megaterium]MCM3792514.1 BhlA/UviB family holin-like peptide [Priestia megaterium]